MPLSSYGQDLGVWTDQAEFIPPGLRRRLQIRLRFFVSLAVAIWVWV